MAANPHMSEEEAEEKAASMIATYDGGKEFMAGVGTVAAAYGYNKFTKGVVASKVAPNGEKVYATTDGGYAVKNGDSFYKVDENGDKLQGADGKDIEVKKDKLKGGISSSFERIKSGMKSGSDTLLERMGAKRLSDTKNGTGNTSQDDQGKEQNSTPKQSSEHSTPPNKDTTGSSPSHTNNSTTNPQTKQEAVSSAKENLSKISSTPNSDFAKGELAMLVGQKEADLIEKHNSGQINDNDFKKQMSGINNLKSKISSGVDIGVADTQKAGITRKIQAGDHGTRSAGEP